MVGIKTDQKRIVGISIGLAALGNSSYGSPSCGVCVLFQSFVFGFYSLVLGFRLLTRILFIGADKRFAFRHTSVDDRCGELRTTELGVGLQQVGHLTTVIAASVCLIVCIGLLGRYGLHGPLRSALDQFSGHVGMHTLTLQPVDLPLAVGVFSCVEHGINRIVAKDLGQSVALGNDGLHLVQLGTSAVSVLRLL